MYSRTGQAARFGHRQVGGVTGNVTGRTPSNNTICACTLTLTRDGSSFGVMQRPEMFFAYSLPPGAQALTTGEMNVVETPPLRRSDREQMPLAGYARARVSAALLELQP